MTFIEISNIKRYTGSSTDTLPTTGVPDGSIAYLATTGTPPVIRRWWFANGAWGREAVDATT